MPNHLSDQVNNLSSLSKFHVVNQELAEKIIIDQLIDELIISLHDCRPCLNENSKLFIPIIFEVTGNN
jgi:hypothetical protein